MGLLSVLTLLDFGMALSTTVLIADTIKSAYLSRSLVDTSPEKSSEPSAASSVDSNTSLSVWSNQYLMWLICEFLLGGSSIKISMGRCRCPSDHLFLLGDTNAISNKSVMPFALSICLCSSLFK